MQEGYDFREYHPLYKENLSRWNYLRDHYTGGIGYVRKGYLSRHERESGDNFRRRLGDSRYPNYCKPINHLFVSHLWRRKPRRVLPDSLAALVQDVDRFGTGIDTFMKQVTVSAGVEGHAFILVDAPAGIEPSTKAEESSFRLRPYFVHLLPQQVLDWEFETEDPGRFGALNRVVLAEPAPQGGGWDGASRYRVFEPERWQLWEQGGGRAKAELLAQGKNKLGEVPIIPVYNLRAGTFMGESTIEDIAVLNHALYQKTSILDEAEYWAGFPQLVIFTDEDVAEVELSQSRALQFRPGDNARFIEHSGTAIESLRATVREIKQDIFRIALKQISEPTQGAGVESASKRKIDRSEFVASLEERSHNFEEAEIRAWGLAAKWMGEDPDKISVEYNHRFDIEILSDSAGQFFMELGEKGYLDQGQVVRELVRHGLLSEDLESGEKVS